MLGRRAIALMITVFFIMAITLSVGIALKYVNEAKKEISKESFMLQASSTLDDVLSILKKREELDTIVKDSDKDAFYTFLSGAAFIPLESSGINISIEISSARSKFNVNSLVENNTTKDKRVFALVNYLNNYQVNGEYVNILIDSMRGIKEDMSYSSSLFNENPYLFRDYVTSMKHLYAINDFYAKTYNENSLNKIKFEDIFYFSKDKGTKIDLNYANKETWRLLLGCTELRAEQLSSLGGSYTDSKSLDLSDEENQTINSFNVSYFEPYLDVKIEVSDSLNSAKIRFEYDMENKKGSNFVYEI